MPLMRVYAPLHPVSWSNPIHQPPVLCGAPLSNLSMPRGQLREAFKHDTPNGFQQGRHEPKSNHLEGTGIKGRQEVLCRTALALHAVLCSVCLSRCSLASWLSRACLLISSTEIGVCCRFARPACRSRGTTVGRFCWRIGGRGCAVLCRPTIDRHVGPTT